MVALAWLIPLVGALLIFVLVIAVAMLSGPVMSLPLLPVTLLGLAHPGVHCPATSGRPETLQLAAHRACDDGHGQRRRPGWATRGSAAGGGHPDHPEQCFPPAASSAVAGHDTRAWQSPRAATCRSAWLQRVAVLASMPEPAAPEVNKHAGSSGPARRQGEPIDRRPPGRSRRPVSTWAGSGDLLT